jgi:hypothetical protein
MYANPRTRAALLLTLLSAVAFQNLNAHPAPAKLPFAPGEELAYKARLGKFGEVGRGRMWIQPTTSAEGRSLYLLQFELSAKVAGARVEDRTQSWFDPLRMASVHYHKKARTPIKSRNEQVEIFPEERRWKNHTGGGGSTPTDAPLDELSFLYFVRTLPLDAGATYSLTRHYDPRRNPVKIRVLRREQTALSTGSVATVVVEMRVTDPDTFGGEGVIRMHLTDDARRTPVRIETPMPVVGTVVLTLDSPLPGR